MALMHLKATFGEGLKAKRELKYINTTTRYIILIMVYLDVVPTLTYEENDGH